MAAWYQVKYSFKMQDDKGQDINTTLIVLFDAVTYTDAEARAYEQFEKEGIKEAFNLEIKRVNFHDMFLEKGERHYKCKVAYIIFDERSQKDKEVPFTFLVLADSVANACEIIISKCGIVQDYRILSVIESKIDDVIKLEENDN